MVTNFFYAPKWRKNIKKIKRKSQIIHKNNDSPKIEKKEEGKSGTISRGAHRERHLSYVCVCRFPSCSKSYFCCSHHLIHLVLGTWIGQQLRQVLEILIQLCWVQKILFWLKTCHKILFSWSQTFCQFWAHLLNFPQATPFICLSSYFLWLLLLYS